jgi:DNA-directed RNA polymerase specialized sigma24 family protein
MDDPRMIDAVAKIFLRPRIWKSRAAFFAFLLTVLQNVLRDEHRRASTVKRGGGVVHVPIMDDDLPSNHLPNSEQTDLIDTMRLLLDRLAEEHPTAHRVLERKLDRAAWADIATDLGISVEVARSQWELARAWIRREFAKIGD